MTAGAAHADDTAVVAATDDGWVVHAAEVALERRVAVGVAVGAARVQHHARRLEEERARALAGVGDGGERRGRAQRRGGRRRRRAGRGGGGDVGLVAAGAEGEGEREGNPPDHGANHKRIAGAAPRPLAARGAVACSRRPLAAGRPAACNSCRRRPSMRFRRRFWRSMLRTGGHKVLDANFALAVAATLVLGGCFSPDLGQGSVRCGNGGACPPGYQCSHGACFANGTDLAIAPAGDMSQPDPPDLAMAPPPIDMKSCVPTVKCSGFCGTIADDGCGQPLRCDCSVPNSCSLGGANSCACTPVKNCNQLPGVHCGRYPDGCGGYVVCPPCGGQQICGAAPQPYTCGNQAMCTPRACLPGQCGLIADDCTDFVICPDCPAPQVCGGAGRPNWCG
jgi:hypothetical protein